MGTSLFQKIIDKLRGKPVRFFAIDKKIKVGKGTEVDSDSIIGDYTCLMEYVQVTKSKIGRYCSIADFVTIGAGEHDLEEISTSGHLAKRSNNYKDLTKMPCEIGPDVWIGVSSIIRRGVKIGVGAVVGANSFVNKDVPPFAVVAGNPAKIIKYRFNEETRQKILDSKYWEYEPEKARKIIDELTNFYENSKKS